MILWLLAFLFLIQAPHLLAEKLTYYSQCGQDRFVNEHIFKGKRNGVFVDIGAYEGVLYSNTYFFEKTLGWTGICIEPIPQAYERLKNVRSAVCVQGCICDQYETVSFLHVQGFAEMLSGILEFYHPQHLSRIENEIRKMGGSYEVIPVKCYNLNELLIDNHMTHVDYLSLDTEGSELEILKSIDFNLIDIDVIDIENNYNIDFQGFLAPLGYKKVFTITPDEIYQKIKS